MHAIYNNKYWITKNHYWKYVNIDVKFNKKFSGTMNVSIQLLKKPTDFLKSITKCMKKYTNFHTIIQKTHKFSKINNKIHEKVYKKIKYFRTWHIKPKNQSKIYTNSLQMT